MLVAWSIALWWSKAIPFIRLLTACHYEADMKMLFPPSFCSPPMCSSPILSYSYSTNNNKPNRCFCYLIWINDTTDSALYPALRSPPESTEHIQHRLSITSPNQNPHSIDPNKRRTQKRKKKEKKLAKSIDLGVYFDPDSCMSNSPLTAAGAVLYFMIYPLV